MNAAFMPPRNMKILGEGRPREPRRATGLLAKRDNTTQVGHKATNSGGMNPALVSTHAEPCCLL